MIFLNFQLSTQSCKFKHRQNLSWQQICGIANEPQSSPAPHSNSTQFVDYSEAVESRSYDPYLITYAEDTNTFTYIDPWVQVDHTNDSCSNDNKDSFNDCTTTEVQVIHEPTFSNACDHNADAIAKGTESAEIVTHCEVVPTTTVATSAEHVPEVSLHTTQAQADSRLNQLTFLCFREVEEN